jgi:L-iditol 2-dehydrogenase
MARAFLPEARFICTNEEDLVPTVMEETGGEGVDLAITTAGTVQAHRDAIMMARHRGFVNLFGGLKNQPELCIDSNIIHYREIFVMGNHGSLPRHHQKAMHLIGSRHVHAHRYVSKTYPLEDLQEAFDFLESREGLKVLVKPGT